MGNNVQQRSLAGPELQTLWFKVSTIKAEDYRAPPTLFFNLLFGPPFPYCLYQSWGELKAARAMRPILGRLSQPGHIGSQNHTKVFKDVCVHLRRLLFMRLCELICAAAVGQGLRRHKAWVYEMI